MKRFTRTALAVLMLLGVAGVFADPARADESTCNDGTTQPGGGTETVILGKPNDPLVLAIQTTPRSGGLTQVILCYGTGENGSTGMLAAGSVHLDTYTYGTSGSQGYVYCDGDETATVSPDCRYDYGATATPSITPTITASGLTLTATVPFRVCLGSCVSDSAALAQTGAVIGTLVPQPPPAGSDAGAGYELSGVKVVLNGRTVYQSNLAVGGIFVADNGAVATSGITGYTYAPCTFGVCVPVPNGYVKLTGNDPTITINRPVVGGSVPVTVPLPYACLYDNNSGTAC